MPQVIPSYVAIKAPLVTLYHHTTEDSKEKDHRWRFFPSQPLEHPRHREKIKNAGYVYFTALDQISCDDDLKCIAMSSDEVIYMTVTGLPRRPPFISSDIVVQFGNEILTLKVPRGSTKDRTATLKFKIDASTLTPQHLLLHTGDLPMWYEVCNPFTHRVGVQPGNTLGAFVMEQSNAAVSRPRRFSTSS